MSSRPEHLAPPEYFYDESESRKYTSNTHICALQAQITRRCLELMSLGGGDRLVLDIGCGSGLSSDIVSEGGNRWIGVDISASMLNAALERGVEGDLFLSDIGQGISFRSGVFDGAISVSVIQWLCNADRKGDNPVFRIRRFFETLYRSLARGSRAVLQAYPEDKYQMELLANSAARAGFGGGWLIDYPNSTKAKKYYLVLFCGTPDASMPSNLISNEEEGGGVILESHRETRRIKPKKIVKGSKAWILAKKERRRRQGKEVRPDSKYTGRRRRPLH